MGIDTAVQHWLCVYRRTILNFKQIFYCLPGRFLLRFLPLSSNPLLVLSFTWKLRVLFFASVGVSLISSCQGSFYKGLAILVVIKLHSCNWHFLFDVALLIESNFLCMGGHFRIPSPVTTFMSCWHVVWCSIFLLGLYFVFPNVVVTVDGEALSWNIFYLASISNISSVSLCVT